MLFILKRVWSQEVKRFSREPKGVVLGHCFKDPFLRERLAGVVWRSDPTGAARLFFTAVLVFLSLWDARIDLLCIINHGVSEAVEGLSFESTFIAWLYSYLRGFSPKSMTCIIPQCLLHDSSFLFLRSNRGDGFRCSVYHFPGVFWTLCKLQAVCSQQVSPFVYPINYLICLWMFAGVTLILNL